MPAGAKIQMLATDKLISQVVSSEPVQVLQPDFELLANTRFSRPQRSSQMFLREAIECLAARQARERLVPGYFDTPVHEAGLFARSGCRKSWSGFRVVRFAIGHLVVDPGVGFFHAGAQSSVRFPPKIFLDEGIVAVSAIDAFGRLQIIASFELDAGNLLNDVNQTVYGHEFVAAEVDWFEDIAVHDRLCAFETIIDVHETSGLMPVTPDLNFMFAG